MSRLWDNTEEHMRAKLPEARSQRKRSLRKDRLHSRLAHRRLVPGKKGAGSPVFTHSYI